MKPHICLVNGGWLAYGQGTVIAKGGFAYVCYAAMRWWYERRPISVSEAVRRCA